MSISPLSCLLSELTDDDEDELKSVNSFSTTATCDDNVGTGRVLDKYFYQPAGRRVERFLEAYIVDANVGTSGESEDNVDDASSASSFSTMATCDDNVGTGRVIDKHVYQALGRKVERLLARIAIKSLPPWQISSYIENGRKYSIIRNGGSMKQSIVFASFSLPDGETIVAGLKSLVRQTQ